MPDAEAWTDYYENPFTGRTWLTVRRPVCFPGCLIGQNHFFGDPGQLVDFLV